MAGSMNRLNAMPPYRIENPDDEVPIGVIGHKGWRYITMGVNNHPNANINDGLGNDHTTILHGHTIRRHNYHHHNIYVEAVWPSGVQLS